MIDFEEDPGALNELDFGALTFREQPKDTSGEGRPLGLGMRGFDPNEVDLFLVQGGYSTTVIPPDMLGIEAKCLWYRIRFNALIGLPPSTPGEWLIRNVLADLRKTKTGRKIKVAAVFAAVGMAIAKTHGVPLKTWERHIAKDVQIKYATLVKIRRLASRLIESRGLNFRLPEWLKYEWS